MSANNLMSIRIWQHFDLLDLRKITDAVFPAVNGDLNVNNLFRRHIEREFTYVVNAFQK